MPLSQCWCSPDLEWSYQVTLWFLGKYWLSTAYATGFSLPLGRWVLSWLPPASQPKKVNMAARAMSLEIPQKVGSDGDKGMGSHGRAEALRAQGSLWEPVDGSPRFAARNFEERNLISHTKPLKALTLCWLVLGTGVEGRLPWEVCRNLASEHLWLRLLLPYSMESLWAPCAPVTLVWHRVNTKQGAA